MCSPSSDIYVSGTLLNITTGDVRTRLKYFGGYNVIEVQRDEEGNNVNIQR